MKAFLIANPRSGSYNSKKIEYMAKKLEKENIFTNVYNLSEQEKIADVIEKIDVNEYSIILLALGDGTINSSLNALINKPNSFKVGLIPMGTANVLAIELEVNKIKKSLQAIINGKTKKVYLGELQTKNNIKYFSLMASTGIDSVVVKNIDENLKKKIGKLAYAMEFIKTLFKNNTAKIETIINGKIYKNALTCVSNGKYYGGKIPVANTNVYKNEFEVIIFNKFSIFSFTKYLFTKKSKNILTFKTNNVEIKSKDYNIPLQLDGDYFCDLPVKIKTTDKYVEIFTNK